MKYIWFIDKDDDIYKVSEDYIYTIYYKRDNYITNYSCKTPNNGFNFYKTYFKLKEISEDAAILEML